MAPRLVAIDIVALMHAVRPRGTCFVADPARLRKLIEEAQKRTSCQPDVEKLSKSLEELERENEVLRKAIREGGLSTSPSGSDAGSKKKKRRAKNKKETLKRIVIKDEFDE
ncbi:unnamed protein product [Heligmosomoides polygyrus]|uniref:Transposase n=1 Tax=Heligmosomoides polygyrus TaxID=6339 RepID=A0A183GLX1_HELPZ|nr:unnamed protein product [Heligmosomoides polygyrus]